MDKCTKCGCETINVTRDSRGLASAFCSECGAFIKKMSTNEAFDFYENKLKTMQEVPVEKVDKPMCKYCTERYAIVSPYATIRPTVIDAKYCPMCGRELKATDRDY